jgi:hypothetical protein
MVSEVESIECRVESEPDPPHNLPVRSATD